MARKKKQKRLTRWNESNLRKLNDEDFIEVSAVAIADRTNLRVDMLDIKNRINQGAPPESIDMLLKEARRRKIPLATIATRFVEKAKSGDSFISTIVTPPAWKRYEMYAALVIIKGLTSRKVKFDSYEFDARIKGKISGSTRQVDLLIRCQQPLHVVACEFKEFLKDRVSIGYVESLVTKLKDVSANKGVIATSIGYQEGAIPTAKHYGIDLLTLKERYGKSILEKYPQAKLPNTINEKYWMLEDENGLMSIFSIPLLRILIG